MAASAASLGPALAAITSDAVRFGATDPIVREALLDRAKRGAELARQIAPVGERAHTLKSGYRDEPGDYRNSIDGSVVFENGRWKGRVVATDFKARWIEFGTKHQDKMSVLQRSRAQLEGA